MPRWSVGGHLALSAASMAGLLQSSACVQVGPPLSCNGPKKGSVFGIDPLAGLKPQVSSEEILCPPSVIR